jgi:DNA invertase Pin-like site-specific DNA recombinase
MAFTIAKYKRCSTNKQELDIQDATLQKFVDRYKEDHPNLTINVLDFKDEGISGKNADRPSLQKLLGLVERRKVDLVVFTKLDRLARSLQDLLNITSKFKDCGVNFNVIEQNIDTSSASGRLLFHIIGAFAEFEREMIRERLESGREKARLIGTKSGKPMHRPKAELDEDGVKYKHKNGWSMRQIAKHYQVSITPIRRILNGTIINSESEDSLVE